LLQEFASVVDMVLNFSFVESQVYKTEVTELF